MTTVLLALILSSNAQESKQMPFCEDWWNYYCCLSADGKRLGIGGSSFIEVGGWVTWSVDDARRLHSGKASGTHALAFSPDGKWLAAGSNSGELAVFDNATGQLYWDLSREGHRAPLHCLQFTAKSAFLISAAGDGMLRLWNIAKKEPQALFTFNSTEGYIRTHTEQYLKSWKRLAGKDVLPGGVNVYAHFLDPIHDLYGFSLSPDGNLLALALGTKTINVLDLDSGKIVRKFVTEQAANASVCFSKDGSLLAIGGGLESPTIEIWDARTCRRINTLRGHKNSILHLAISPDNKTLLSGGLVDGACLWDLWDGKQKFRFHSEKQTRVVGVGFFPNGETFNTLPEYTKTPIHFWNTRTGKQVAPPGTAGP